MGGKKSSWGWQVTKNQAVNFSDWNESDVTAYRASSTIISPIHGRAWITIRTAPGSEGVATKDQ
ncbi:hypothetical protein GOEFS_104_00070 [Gordonia effusa NBRC 100432]|uniref:Uncharacterized protein n=1 Tax=Gordonia effusa NBRC 100432 TaxID=1077974 RepID=H0R4I7_9ACTN|nr:hypothetical protein GOEFS_104_00070 [Gordonia effusa NBRC 100432]